MADCELLSTCLFFNDMMRHMPAMAEHHKQKYCRGDNRDCARYLVFVALCRTQIPADLFPIETARAQKIIADATR